MRKKASKKMGGGPPDGEGAKARVLGWAHRIIVRDGASVRSHVAVARESGIEEVMVTKVLDGVGGREAVFGTAVVVSRTAADDELVAVIMSANVVGTKHPKGPPEWAAIVALRSRRGAFSARMYEARRESARSTIIAVSELTEAQLAFEDWTDQSKFVDPELENLLAISGVPGANRQLRPSAALAVPPAAVVPRAFVPPSNQLRERQPLRRLMVPWEAAKALMSELNDGGPGELIHARFAHVPAGIPVGLESRSFEDLLRSGWTSDAQAVLVMWKLTTVPSLAAALDSLLAAKIPRAAALAGRARIADLALGRGELATACAAANALVKEHDEDVGRAGGIGAWLAETWPSATQSISDFLVTVRVGSAADAAMLPIFLAELQKTPERLEPAAAGLEALRDALLDRLGARPADHAGARVVEVSARFFHALPSPDGERRERRWLEVLREREASQTVDQTLRDYAAYYTTWLHTIATLTRSSMARTRALGSEHATAWRPDLVPTAGLLTRGHTVLGRHCVMRAMCEPNPRDGIPFLARACVLLDGDERYARVYNEARSRTEELARYPELLGDLLEENRRSPSLAACAEMLNAAERNGTRHQIAAAQRRLRNLARLTPHAWMSEARITLGRPIERSERERVAQLRLGGPPAALDTDERVVAALYGSNPDLRVLEVREALRAQDEALEWAALVREVRAEERSSPPSGEGLPRPDVPVAMGDGALARALAALRFRLDRRGLAKHAHKPALEAHARRACELVASDGQLGAGWLAALRGDDGLVAALDAALGGDDTNVLPALERAEASLVEGRRAYWLLGTLSRLQAVWPLLPSNDGELRRRVTDLASVAGDARDDDARAEVEGRLAGLFLRAQEKEIEASSPEDVNEPLDDDGFVPMTLDPDALAWSRKELDTPEWAIVEGCRQVAFYNLARGRRDLKMLRGTRGDAGALWELRHRDGRHPVRVMYVHGGEGPRVVAVLAKQDDAHQGRMIERVRGALRGGRTSGREV